MKAYGKINGREVGFIERFIHAGFGSYERLESTHEQNVAFLDKFYKTLITVTLGGMILIPILATINNYRTEKPKEDKIEKILIKVN